jgi:hypothetical protein
MIHDKEECIINLKFTLYCFESMSEMKINYHKSEMFVLGGDQQRMEEIATKFNYKLGSLPKMYPGFQFI